MKKIIFLFAFGVFSLAAFSQHQKAAEPRLSDTSPKVSEQKQQSSPMVSDADSSNTQKKSGSKAAFKQISPALNSDAEPKKNKK